MAENAFSRVIAALFAGVFLVTLVVTGNSLHAMAAPPPGLTGVSVPSPWGVGVNAGTRRVYVAGTDSVTVLHADTNAVLATTTVRAAPTSIAVNAVANRVYVSHNSPTGGITVIDGTTNSIVASPAFGSFSTGVAFNPVTNKLYVTSEGANAVTVLNAATNGILTTIFGFAGPSYVAANPATNRIYVTNWSGGGPGTVKVIDGGSDTVIATVPVGSGPRGIDVNPATNKIYVANAAGGGTTVIDGASNSVLTTITAALGTPTTAPHDVAVNPVTGRIYLTSLRDITTVGIVNATTDAVLSTVDVGNGILYSNAFVDVDTTTNRVYVANNSANTLWVFQGDSPFPPPNAPPACGGTNIVLSEDTPLSRDLKPQCADPNGDTIEIEIVSLSLVGVSAVPAFTSTPHTLPGGTITLNPAANYNGPGGSLQFRARDSKGALSNVVTATVTVTAVDDAPVVTAPGAVTLVEGESTSIPLDPFVTDIETHDPDIIWSAVSSHPSVVINLDAGARALHLNAGPGPANGSVTITAKDRGDPNRCGEQPVPVQGCAAPLSANASFTVTVDVPDAPTFSIPADPVPGACICTPLVMNTNNTGVEHWWVKADSSGTLTMTVSAHSVNETDPETVVARIFPVSGVGPELATATSSYTSGTPPGTEVASAPATVSGPPGAVYLVRVTTPGTPPTQPHYRLKFNGAVEAAIKSPTFRSIEPETPVRWYVNVGPSESLGMRIFGDGVPLPNDPGTATFGYQFDGDVAATVSATVTPGPFGGYSATISPAASPAGKREFAMLSTLFVADLPSTSTPSGIHYRLEALSVADNAVYLGPFSYGYGDIVGTVSTSGGAPFPDPVTVNLYEGPSGPFIGSTLAGAGTFSFPNLLVGTYRVEIVPTGDTNIVGPPSHVVVVTCDMDSPVSFVLNRPPVANAGQDQAVNEGSVVNLNGTGSSDPDGNYLAYDWVQSSGPAVELTGPGTATPTFTAPDVTLSLTLTFELTVDDGHGGTSTATVTVTVNDVVAGADARTIGYWKNHQAHVDEMLTQGPIELGDTTVSTVALAVSVLGNASGKDARNSLRAQSLATILNLRNGSDPSANGPDIRPTVTAAVAFLASHPTPVDGKHPDRAAALGLKDLLDGYNNSGE